MPTDVVIIRRGSDGSRGPTGPTGPGAEIKSLKNDYSSNLSTMVATLLTTEATVAVDVSGTLAADTLTIPATIHLRWYRNCIWEIESGKTLDAGTIDAGEYQLFSGDGTVTLDGDRNSAWFGTAADGLTASATANSTAINKALVSFGTNGGTLTIPKNTKFTLSSLTFAKRQNIDYWCDDDTTVNNFTRATNERVHYMANSSTQIANEHVFAGSFHPAVSVDARSEIAGHDDWLGVDQSRTNPVRASFVLRKNEMTMALLGIEDYPDNSHRAANGIRFTPYYSVFILFGIATGDFTVTIPKYTLVTGSTSGATGIFLDFAGYDTDTTSMRILWVSGVFVEDETVEWTMVELGGVVTGDFNRSAPVAGEYIYQKTSTAYGSFIDFGGDSSCMRCGKVGDTFVTTAEYIIYDKDDTTTRVPTSVTETTITSSTTITTRTNGIQFFYPGGTMVWDRNYCGNLGIGLFHAEHSLSIGGRIGIQKTEASTRILHETITYPGITFADNLTLPTIEKSLLLDTADSTVQFSGSLAVGQRYYLHTYAAGDDFSNVATVISGEINKSGCYFWATGTTPTVWTNLSRLYKYPNRIKTYKYGGKAGTTTYQCGLVGAVSAFATIVVADIGSSNGGIEPGAYNISTCTTAATGKFAVNIATDLVSPYYQVSVGLYDADFTWYVAAKTAATVTIWFKYTADKDTSAALADPTKFDIIITGGDI